MHEILWMIEFFFRNWNPNSTKVHRANAFLRKRIKLLQKEKFVQNYDHKLNKDGDLRSGV